MVENLGKTYQSDAKCIGPALEFNDVETADASLALADEGLVLANSLSELDLAHIDPFASCPKFFKEVEVLGSVKGLGHRRPAWAAESFNAIFDYAKIASLNEKTTCPGSSADDGRSGLRDGLALPYRQS